MYAKNHEQDSQNTLNKLIKWIMANCYRIFVSYNYNKLMQLLIIIISKSKKIMVTYISMKLNWIELNWYKTKKKKN